jgi:hypothetical protein
LCATYTPPHHHTHTISDFKAKQNRLRRCAMGDLFPENMSIRFWQPQTADVMVETGGNCKHHWEAPMSSMRKSSFAGYKRFIHLCVTLILLCLGCFSVYGQSDCATPQVILPNDTQNIVLQDSVYWVSFTYQSPGTTIKIFNKDPQDSIQLQVYSNCYTSIPALFSQNELKLNDSSLQNDSVYLIKVSRITLFNDTISFSLILLPQPMIKLWAEDQFCEGMTISIRNQSYYIDNGISSSIMVGYFHVYYRHGGILYHMRTVPAINWTQGTFRPFNSNNCVNFPPAPGYYDLCMIWTATSTPIPTQTLGEEHDCQTVQIIPTPNVTITQSPPNTVCSGMPVTLTASASNTQWPTYLWSTAETTDAIIVQPITNTTYSVTVTEDGCEGINSVTIEPLGLTPDFSFTAACATDPVVFANITQCASLVQSWHWNFGDGTTSTAFQPTHTFQGGLTSYNVTLSATYINGGTHSVSNTVNLLPSPVISPINGKNNNCDGNTITYSVPAIYSSYLWSIIPANAGTIISGAGTDQVTIEWDPLHLPAIPGYATLILTVTNTHNCEASFEMRVFVCCPPPPGAIHYNGGTISSNVQHSNQTIYINDHLIIEGSFTVDAQSTVFMGPDAIIEAKNGGSIAILESSVSQYCEFMWQSIKATDDQSTVVVNGSTVRDGQVALQSENGASLTVSGYSQLENNYIAIKINDYLPSGGIPVPNILLIQSSITTSGNLQFEPYLNQEAFAGVVVDKVNQVTIGANQTQSANRLKFSKMRYGIKIHDAYVKVLGCEFYQIETAASSINTRIASQGAIVALHSYLSIANGAQKKLEVGSGTPGDQCVFSNGKVAIYAENCLVKIIGSGVHDRNLYSDMTAYAIKLINPHKGSEVLNNNINQSRIGIWAANVLKGNPSRPFGYITIANNNIDNGRLGIWTQNLSTSLLTLKVRVQDNNINLDGNLDDVYGIRVDACDGINVSGNSITRGLSFPTDNDIHNKRGIWLARTKRAAIYDNAIFNMGSGIYGNGDMINTQFFCNALTNCWHSFYFGDLSVITNQGYPGTPNYQGWITNNIFYNPLDYKLAGSLNLNTNLSTFSHRLWYYNGNAPQEFVPAPIPLPLSQYVTADPLISNYLHSCNTSTFKISAITIEDAYQRDQMLGDILYELNEYIQLPDEFIWYEKAYLYEVLSGDTSLMYLDADPDYANFYYLMQNDNIGQFASIRDLIASGEILRAEELNAEINDTSVIGTNIRTLNNIYLKTVERDRHTFTQEETDALMDIALQTPYFGGDAVYEARVLLGLDILDYPSIPYRQKSPVKSLAHQFLLYPNPASDLLIFESPFELEFPGVMQLFTSAGKLVKSQVIASDLMQFSMDISDLSPGIYFYTYVSPNFTTNGKFVKK